MRMWTDAERESVLDYLIANHADGVFDERPPNPASELPFKIEDAAAVAQVQLEAAIATRNGDVVEAALWLARVSDMPQEAYFMLACRLLTQDWHHCHEELISEFQEAEDPRAVVPLRHAIDLKPRLRYLEYDDYGSYYKKCLWALTEIGTPEAIAVIRDCADSHIEPLSLEARYRLTKIGE